MSGKEAGKTRELPALNSDAEAERFVAEADLSTYDLSKGSRTHFEFDKKDAQINIRMPSGLVDAVKARAAKRGIPYQRFIREAVEKALDQHK